MPQDPLSHHFATQAYNNAWANHRLLSSCSRLSQTEFGAARTSLFPSIRATLNHILSVDCFYIDALERAACGQEPHPDVSQFFENEEPFENCASLQQTQRAADARLIAYCLALDDASLSQKVRIIRPATLQVETRTRLLSHLFEHQTHHRGQVHAMLSGTTLKPPQLDEFFCVLDEPLRAADFSELGFSEKDIWS